MCYFHTQKWVIIRQRKRRDNDKNKTKQIITGFVGLNNRPTIWCCFRFHLSGWLPDIALWAYYWEQNRFASLACVDCTQRLGCYSMHMCYAHTTPLSKMEISEYFVMRDLTPLFSVALLLSALSVIDFIDIMGKLLADFTDFIASRGIQSILCVFHNSHTELECGYLPRRTRRHYAEPLMWIKRSSKEV